MLGVPMRKSSKYASLIISGADFQRVVNRQRTNGPTDTASSLVPSS